MHACDANVSYHLGVARALSMLKRFYSWIDIDICTRWWLRRCLQCQARASSTKTVRWFIVSLPLPFGPGIAMGVDSFGPLPVITRENSCVLIFTDRFSHSADVYAVSVADFTAKTTADTLVNKYIPGTIFGVPGKPPLR